MNNELYRKLTSITLMTIMFAGGMTIAIPGETPVAVAQTGMLSVSATAAPGNSFGGPQIIQIIVDDPTRSDLSPVPALPDVTIDGSKVTMQQADTGKWYGHVADLSAVTDANAVLDADDDVDTDTISAPPTRDTVTFELQTTGIDFDDDSDIDVVYGDETITLHYEEDLDGLATVSTDRTDGVPVDGEIHVTVSDFRLNLDPTGEDVWTVYADGSMAAYENDGVDAITAVENWVGIFGGLGGKLTVTADDGVVGITAAPTDPPVGTITLTETGANTGVFESQNGDDNDSSNIVATGDENDDFKIAYADSDVQVFIEDFDSTLEVIANGAWDSGESLTVRLSNENLNTNTLTEQDMAIGDKYLPVLIQGDPITLHTVTIARAGDAAFGEEWSVDENTQVATLRATNTTTTFTVTLTTGPDSQLARLTSDAMSSYVHYSSEEFTATTDAQLNITGIDPAPETDAIPVVDGAPLRVLEGADGTFDITFTTDAIDDTAAEQNEAVGVALEAAVNATADGDSAQDVKAAATGAEGTPTEGFTAALTAIDENEDGASAESILEAIREAADANLNEVTGTIVADIFTFGADANDAIYRALLEETDSASGVFEGTIEYEILNQRTVDSPDTHDNVAAIGNELAMILDTGYTGSDAPEFTYDEDNASEDAPTNTGEVSVDASTYRVSDDVTITLVDADLNTDSGAREIYRIVDSSGGTEMPRVVSIAIGDLSCVSDVKDVSLRETASDSGTFEGSFEVPAACGVDADGDPILTTGESITVTYEDFRDENGGDSEWTDSATIGADTGSVSLDRTVYPVPTAAATVDGIDIEATTVTIAVAVDDSDVDTSSSSTQSIRTDQVELTVAGLIVDLGELKESEPDSGIFEVPIEIGPRVTGLNDDGEPETKSIEQGDIITVRYTDESDASGNENSVSDSATFDLRNAVLQSDKSVYVIGQDALLTLIEADLNLDSGTIDNVNLDRINWDSEAYDGSLHDVRADLGPVPTNLRETGENTGIFQVVITISDSIDGNALERGEEITLAYLDRGPSGADFVGDDERDVELQIETSNFGATVELDQNVYTWTDKVFITVVASDYNFDSNIIDEIGTTDKGEITIRTRAGEVQYRLAETGPDTGVFTGELVLTGDNEAGIEGVHGTFSRGLAGPTDGTINTRTSDGISISFDYSDSEAPLVASALIRWNVGEVQWLEASYAATGSGIVRIIDPDMNINPDAVDSIDAVVYSETFIGGIELTLTETQEASGIFEGTVEFDPESASDGHRLQVTEGDIVTAEYEDETLPKPNNGDTLEITATTLIGSIVPPLERAPASNPAIVDAFGNSLASVSVDQQVQITADLTSGQDRDQDFAFLVQIQNEDGVTVELSWIAGTLGAGATFNAAQSWTPSETGSYTATIFVWESVSNPTALSPQLSITIDVV